jgi:predicted regulator of Ras-like GTPase activity (Roadblock/LC7/MglB family)
VSGNHSIQSSLDALMKEEGITRCHVIDPEGNALLNNGDRPLESQVLTAMFATIFAAAETSFYEMGVVKDPVVKLETDVADSVLIFRVSQDILVVLEGKKPKGQTGSLMEKLKSMLPETLGK